MISFSSLNFADVSMQNQDLKIPTKPKLLHFQAHSGQSVLKLPCWDTDVSAGFKDCFVVAVVTEKPKNLNWQI